ncbi:dual specificity protein phosphatase 19-like [Aricia agestis]|uniref:dual specificity protein phosphatase 19-like n=1 Tax=Aricia agestis TaxID=91739 RepID=UPI001C209010|nr:dual specificity protein phosphatase 19-like [Aricia agestis]
MSFLNELKRQKSKLKETVTVVTNIDGAKHVEGSQEIIEHTFGFVVDTKPDNIPVMIVDHVYIGSQDCTDIKVITDYNIQHVLSLGVDVHIEGVNKKFVNILDLPESDVRHVLQDCLPFVKNAVDLKENVLIHCNAGVSRTSMVVIAFLMHYHSMPFEEAYKFVKEKRPAIQPNSGFKIQLQNMRAGAIL